jgi:hypothetical protein
MLVCGLILDYISFFSLKKTNKDASSNPKKKEHFYAVLIFCSVSGR